MLGSLQRSRIPRANSFVWIFVGALVLRACYLIQGFQGNELIAYPAVDQGVYLRWARDILGGKWLWSEAINYTPGHPIWLSGWLAVFGEHPAVHFAGFLLLGSVQAVMIALIAERVWDRRVGLVAGWLAATYWPFIIFEASYFAEPFAILSLTLMLFLLVRGKWREGELRPLCWAGFCLGWSILARANAMFCAAALAGWIAWETYRSGIPRRTLAVFRRVAVFVIPIALLLAPVLFWNWRITGRAMLRTDGWLSVYAGNAPELRGKAIPVGVRWTDFVYRPVRAGFTDANSKETFWRNEVLRVMREQRPEWWKLMGRKAMMLIGSYEVSQEIDIAIYRASSSMLAWLPWPGWALVVSLASGGILAMARSTSARRGWPLALCAAAYFASIVPVQAASRYRLPMIVPLLPIAAWTVVAFADAIRARDRRSIFGLSIAIALPAIAIAPDWLKLAHERSINHWYLVGEKRSNEGDESGAYAAFAQGAAWNPEDPDCPLRMGHIARHRGNVEEARTLYTTAFANFSACHQALVGLGECALTDGHPAETLERVQMALQIAPNNLDALHLATRAHAAAGDWKAMALTFEDMRSYLAHPASVEFSEAWAWTLAGRTDAAFNLYRTIATTPRFSSTDRDRAALLSGALMWRETRNREQAMRFWQPLADGPPGFFQILASMLCGRLKPQDAAAQLPRDITQRTLPYLIYTRALTAWINGDLAEARSQLEELLAVRNARQLAVKDREILEVWALNDLERLGPKP